MALLTNAKKGEHYRTRNGLVATLYAILTGCERYQYCFYVCGRALSMDEVLERVFSSEAVNRKVLVYENGLQLCEGYECDEDVIEKL